MTADKKLRLAVIGSCRRGALADRAHDPSGGVEVVAGADVSEEKLGEFRERYREKFNARVAGYLDYRLMLEKEKPDGVFITSPDYCHEEQAVFALGAGVPVFLEKPMAISTAGCDRILEAAWKSGARLMVGHNMRYMSFTRKMKEIIDSGEIGEVRAIWCRHFVSYGGDAYFRDWHAERRYANSLLLQKGAHDIDIIQWLAGARARRVTGLGSLSVYDRPPRRAEGAKVPPVVFDEPRWPPLEQSGFNPVVDLEDTSMILMHLGNGVVASYQQCHFTPDSCRNYTVIGTRGRLENYGDHHEDTTIEVWTSRRDRFRLRGDESFPSPGGMGGHGGADPLIVGDFVAMLRGAAPTGATAQDARYSVAAGCCGADSLRAGGRPFEVPTLAPELENHDFRAP